jgi:hypothetical protein
MASEALVIFCEAQSLCPTVLILHGFRSGAHLLCTQPPVLGIVQGHSGLLKGCCLFLIAVLGQDLLLLLLDDWTCGSVGRPSQRIGLVKAS